MTDAEAPKSVWTIALKRAAIYFLGLDLLAFFYYALGSYQGFLAETQLPLLRLVSVFSIAAFLSGTAGLVREILLWILGRRRAAPAALAGWAACIAGASVLAVLSQAVRAFAAGV